MFVRTRFPLAVFLSLLAAQCLWGCAGEQKEAKLEIVDVEYSMRSDHEHHYVVDAKGVIRNAGEVDVKNVEITGYCNSCREEILDGEWFVSQYEKMPHQKDIISHLPAGGEENFEFEEVAFCVVNRKKTPPEKLPEGLEISIESYEIAK